MFLTNYALMLNQNVYNKTVYLHNNGFDIKLNLVDMPKEKKQPTKQTYFILNYKTQNNHPKYC